MLLACGLLNAGNVSMIFRWAAEADPAAQLCLNEWGVLEGGNWQGLAELAQGMLALGAPLGCLGVQVCVWWVRAGAAVNSELVSWS
jgi:GH35 family endo-1,4-beta-xylanase